MDALPVKPFLDYPELVKTLTSRKMIIDDPLRAARKIEQIGYYHLSGYWHLARKYSFNEKKNTFTKKTFEMVHISIKYLICTCWIRIYVLSFLMLSKELRSFKNCNCTRNGTLKSYVLFREKVF